MRPKRVRNLLLLTEEEASRLADAVNGFHVPRSLIILEAIQAGLQAGEQDKVRPRRSRIVYFRLPAEVKERVKKAAHENSVSQQSLIRHLLSTYLSNLERMPRPRQGTTEPKSLLEELEIEA